MTDELSQRHQYEQQQLRNQLSEQHDLKMTSLRKEFDDINDNDEGQFMDSLNVSKFNVSVEQAARRREEHEKEIQQLKRTYEEEMNRLKKTLDEELDELRTTLQDQVCTVVLIIEGRDMYGLSYISFFSSK